MKKIEFHIGADGQIRTEAHGYSGCGCAEVTQKFIDALQGQILSDTKKAEYYEVNSEYEQESSHY